MRAFSLYLDKLLLEIVTAEIDGIDWPKEASVSLSAWDTFGLSRLASILPVIQQEVAQILENRQNESCRTLAEPIKSPPQ